MTAHSPERRSFLKKGIFGAAILLVGGAVPLALRGGLYRARPRGALRLFTPHEYAIFAAIAGRMVPGDGADDAGWPTAEALDCAGKADVLMAQAHPKVGAELRQLLRLFESGLGGLFTNARPTPFTRLGPAEMDARIEAWHHSRLALLRSGYQALKRLAQATYYSSPETYARVGYPGPPALPKGPA